MTTLKVGSKGSEVRELQAFLQVQVDGVFGKRTKAAVIEFQKAHNLIADGIVGAKTWAVIKTGEIPADFAIPCEDLKQYASPHGSMIYGKDSSYSTYKNGGCGVVSFAVVYRAYGLAGSEKSTDTIQRLGRYSVLNGYRPKNQGTNAGLFNTNGCKSTTVKTADAIETALRSGKLVILLIKKGFPNGYTGKGHYIVAYGIKDGYVLLRDVGSSAASRQKALLSKITSGLKNAFVIERRDKV